MKIYMIIGFILFIILILTYIIYVYNKLIKARNRVRIQWAQIDVQLVRRADLIPNLVQIVKGYASHEKDILEKITLARSSIHCADTPKQVLEINDQLSKDLHQIFAVTENYPDLRSNQNFLDLQEQIKETENKIAYARQFYNDTVLIYKDTTSQFPQNIVAGIFKFKDASYYTDNEENKAVISVDI